ncbi:synaptic vesicle glycoprotein 2B-like [Acyrthosiphon pisum]|uniref:Major facilitator superfamily (MFS) profile domain-containing protein n=1 Tax=Acyrthosiphon pisum TaxID=7029 RepID=A0A8R1W5C1_ACYPI|nr:synaptic vesicle glycoprotein 2B-like [Acyrthosiphon pisum]|eukprot:XP_001947988.2 PREDICTED: synaptic vesicle glycoprotein 2B-like [Acyrthosiphon pisum]
MDNHHIDGVGRFSMLAQGALDEVPSDINIGVRKSENDDSPVTFEEAQNESGTGKYQIVLLVVCGLVNMSCAISTTAVSFISPAAEVDFDLNSTTKGILNGAPFLGMVLGAYFWGIFGDLKGRRLVILGSMGMDTFFTILSSLAQHVGLFFILRVGNGFAIIGATCMVYVYLGEFLTPSKRDSYLLFLELYWALGMMVGPGLAMVIIPSNIVLISSEYFKFNAWRIFILLTSIPSLISFILIYQYPETPRYLMFRGYLIKSREVLERIYLVNNKFTTVPYPVEVFTQTHSAIWFDTGFIGGIPFMKNVKRRLTVLKNGHITLFSEYFRNIIVACIIEFCLMASYITILVWVPELFSRYSNYKLQNTDGVNICTASEWHLKYNTVFAEQTVSSNAYLAALVVASSTIPLVLITGIIIKYVDKKLLLFMTCGIPAIFALLVSSTQNDLQAELLCCLFEGFTALTEPIIFCTIVELFPSNVRGVAFSMIVMTGRLGAIFGIIVFGILIDRSCFMTFYGLALLVLIAFIAVAFLPKLKIGGH